MQALKYLWYRTQWNMRPKLKWAGRAPLHVDMELTNKCNFKCSFCHQATNWLERGDRQEASWHLIKLVIKQCRDLGVPSMKFNWRGEPLIHGQCERAIRVAKNQGIMEVQLNTNASLLDGKHAEDIIASRLDRLIVSCDSADRDTYNRLRRGGDFDKFVNNLRMFRAKCDEAKSVGKKVPRVRMNVAVQSANCGELERIEEFFGDLVDEFRYNEIYNPMRSIDGGESRVGRKRGCPQIYQRLIVSAEGDIIPCCVDYKKMVTLGNILSGTTLGQAWRKCDYIRRAHEKHKARAIASCGVCDNFALSELDATGRVIWR